MLQQLEKPLAKIIWKQIPKQNEKLHEFEGLDYNPENKRKIMDYVFQEHFRLCNYKNPLGSIAFVYQVDPITNKILNVSAGTVFKNRFTRKPKSDLVLDNLGILLGAWTKLLSTGGSGFYQLVKTNGALGSSTQGYSINSSVGNSEFFSQSGARPIGWSGQLGKGTTPPTRQDFVIESPLITTGGYSLIGAYDSVGFQVLWSGVIVVGTGGETVSECVSTKTYSHGTGTTSSENAMRTRDLVTPTFVTITGKTIFVDVVFNI